MLSAVIHFSPQGKKSSTQSLLLSLTHTHSRISPFHHYFQVRAADTISTNDFKVGTNVVVDNAPCKVVEFMHVKPGKGSAFVRSKLKNYVTKRTIEKTFRAGEKLPTADVEKRTMQYTYKDGEQYVFMDMETYEETRIEEDDFTKFLIEGHNCAVLSWNGKIIGVDLPLTVELEVGLVISQLYRRLNVKAP
jgi:translation elongation factor P